MQEIYRLVNRYNASLEAGEDTDFIKDLIGDLVTKYNQRGPVKPLIITEDSLHYYSLEDHVSLEW